MQKKKKKEKIFFASVIFASEFVAINCLCSERNTCHRQSMGYKKSSKIFHIT